MNSRENMTKISFEVVCVDMCGRFESNISIIMKIETLFYELNFGLLKVIQNGEFLGFFFFGTYESSLKMSHL